MLIYGPNILNAYLWMFHALKQQTTHTTRKQTTMTTKIEA